MKKTIDKIINNGYKFILIFTIICLSISLIGAIFFCVNRSFNYLNPIVLIPGSLIYLLLIIKLYKYLIKLDDKKKKIISVVLLILQFILLFISSQIISSVPKVDLIHILTEINNLNDKGKILNNNYFSVYPNNRFLVFILYIIQKIPLNNHILFGLISSLSITTMSLFTYKTVTKISNINKGLLSLFLCVFSPIFYLYVSYYYTDILMLPLASILIYLMVKIKDNSDTKINIIYGILIGVISIIGYKIRAVCIFPLIAYIIYIFISRKSNILKRIAPILLGLIVTLVCVKTIDKCFFPHINEEKQFPMTHWIMMGVNAEKNGYYNHADYIMSDSEKTVSDRTKLNIEVIKERLSNQGIFKTGELLVSKLVTVWGKGDYSYQKYLDLVNDYNKSYNYLLEDKNIALNYVLQFSKIAILVLCIIALIKLLKAKEKSFMAIAIFGAILFYLIWEVCPRYGLSFLPWLIILSSYSYDSLNINFEKFKFYKYVKYIIIILTVILFIFGFNKYTSIHTKNDMVSKSTSNKVKYVELNKDTSITQSLKLNSNFNRIKLLFRLNNSDIDSTFKLELLNKLEEVLYTQQFSIEDIKDEKYTTFKLDKNYSKGNYIIRITSSNDSGVETLISYKEQYDYYPEGNLEVNGKEETGDLSFEVVYNNKRGIYTCFEYIIIVVISLSIEYVVLFRRKDEVNE